MDTRKNWPITAKILEGTRRALWIEIFPDAVLPIKSMFTIKTDLPGHPGADAYMLDLDAISPDQRAKMIDVLATRFNIPREELADEIEKGVPILAEGVSVESSAISLRKIL
jgi:hypothetical protein